MGTFCAKGHGSVSFTIYHHPDKFQASLSWHWWLRMIWPCFLFPASPHSPPTWTLYPSATEPPAGTQVGPAFCQLLRAFVPQYLLSQGCPSWLFFLLFNSSYLFRCSLWGASLTPPKEIISAASPRSLRCLHHGTSWTILPKKVSPSSPSLSQNPD